VTPERRVDASIWTWLTQWRERRKSDLDREIQNHPELEDEQSGEDGVRRLLKRSHRPARNA
jgi:hypothetical protein